MAEQQSVNPTHLNSEEKHVGALFVVCFALGQVALFVAVLAPIMVSMAIKVISVVGDEQATSAQGLILGVGALAAIIGAPIFGSLSDHTTSRFGRRRPWLIGGAFVLAICLFVISQANTIAILVIAWFCAQLASNASFAAFFATIADQVPPSQSAKIASLTSVMQNVAMLLAIFLAGLFTSDMLLMFMVPAVIGVAGMAIYALILPDKPLTGEVSPFQFSTLLRAFWVNPKENPDFCWAFGSKFMVILGFMLFVAFRFFWMKDQIGLNDDEAAKAIFKGVLIYTIVLMIVAPTTGWLSDRIQMRKPFVVVAMILFAIGFVMLTKIDTVEGFYWLEAFQGLAFGIYAGVDLALIISLLPNQKDTAKDLGVYNIAQAAPQSLAPFLGALLIGGADKNYVLLYSVAAVVCVIGACLILPIRKVK